MLNQRQVSISPDKKDIYIAINISEGVNVIWRPSIKLAGDLILPEDEFRAAMKIKRATFLGESLNESTKVISEKLSAKGCVRERMQQHRTE